MPITDLERRRDAIEVRLEQLGSKVPGRRPRTPRYASPLVRAQYDPIPLLAHVDLSLEVNRVRQLVAALSIECHDFWHVVGHEIHMFHGENGQLDSNHASHFARPEPACVDDVLGVYCPFRRHDIPASVWPA